MAITSLLTKVGCCSLNGVDGEIAKVAAVAGGIKIETDIATFERIVVVASGILPIDVEGEVGAITRDTHLSVGSSPHAEPASSSRNSIRLPFWQPN